MKRNECNDWCLIALLCLACFVLMVRPLPEYTATVSATGFSPAAAISPAALPDIPACGTSDRPDLVLGYIVCAINTLYAENQALKARVADIETIRRPSAYADRLWAFMGDRGEADERRRLTYVDPRRQDQTKVQIYRALCRERLVTC